MLQNAADRALTEAESKRGFAALADALGASELLPVDVAPAAKALIDSRSCRVLERDGVRYVLVLEHYRDQHWSFQVHVPVRPEGPSSAIEPGLYRDSAQPRPLPRPSPVHLQREANVDRVGKALGFNAEVQTGDAGFDRDVYVDSDSKRVDLAPFLAPSAVRAAVLELFAAGAESIDLYPLNGHVAATLRQRIPTPSEFEAVLRPLGVLIRALPLTEGPARPVRHVGCMLGLAGLALAAITGVAAFVVGLVGSSTTTLFAATSVLVKPLLGVWLALIVASVVLARGASDGLRQIAGVFFCWGAALGLGGVFALQLEQALAPAQTYVANARVHRVRADPRRTRSVDLCTLFVEGMGESRLLDRRICDGLIEGGGTQVVYRRGVFGSVFLVRLASAP